ncbi:MAG: TrkA family potassium uptake protein, partial [Candidatus Borkfalkiaceae bacterium]|nr:TrkA family potassium uptake protein [Christensenellaceae bacterium]
VQNFDACIVAIGTDFQSSLETASLLKESGAKRVISRASSDRQANLLLKIGADEIVFPEKQIADWAAIRYGADNVFDYLKISGEYSLFEVGVPESWTGKTVTEVDVRRKYGVNIIALKKNGTVDPVITPDTVFTAGETLLVLGKFKEMQKCFKM